MKITVCLLLAAGIISLHSYAQKRYGYAILMMRCGDDDSNRNIVYFSPVIELNGLNFKKYTDGMDPAIPLHSVRYYNYAILKWFEIYLRQSKNIAYNHPERYERKASAMIYNRRGNCNNDKTLIGCFFTDKNELALQRTQALKEARLDTNTSDFCEVVDVE